MDKSTRNAIERATQQARKLLEDDFSSQLEGTFDVLRSGVIAPSGGVHLSARQQFQRGKIVAAIDHKRAVGMTALEAVADYVRDAAFTTLNRFVALKMLEVRELVQECVTKGEHSAGYREFCGMATGLPLLAASAGYRLYVESLFDELSTEVKVLFDRRDPSSVLWPKRVTFELLLEILNANDLTGVWRADETIGWIYQFFNGEDERRKMREESHAPRNSRELAVRNQFFTPRYVVQFLTDNTLGRIWYEMRSTMTVLAERSEYMVREHGEEFMPRAKKDPRDLRVLDPACGSGHFLLYAFDLLLAIYEEAHADHESPKSERTGRTLAEDYPSIDALRDAVPGLILSHNLYGVDIDPRCAQIAQFALWMRAQKACGDLGIGRASRLQIRRSNIVVAEPLVADEQTTKDFVARLNDAELGSVFTRLIEALDLAGDMGLLLRVETLVGREAKRGHTGDLFTPAEERIRAALARFMSNEGGLANTRRRLFADDTAQGMGLLAIAETKFDVVLMNPPFGDPSAKGRPKVEELYPSSKQDLACCFLTRAAELTGPRGLIGALTSRTIYFLPTSAQWRRTYFGEQAGLEAFADLGLGVLDSAMVETAAIVSCAQQPLGRPSFFDATEASGAPDLLCALSTPTVCEMGELLSLPLATFCYWALPEVLTLVRRWPTLSDSSEARQGLATTNDFRTVRLWFEVLSDGEGWPTYAKGGDYQPFVSPPMFVVRWSNDGEEIKALVTRDPNTKHWSRRVAASQYYGRKGLTWTERTSWLSLVPLRQGAVFGVTGKGFFVAEDDEARLCAAAGTVGSSIFQYIIRLFMGRTEAEPKFQAGDLQRIPCASELLCNANIATAQRRCIESHQWIFEVDERTVWFRGPYLSGQSAGLIASHHDVCERVKLINQSVADDIQQIEKEVAVVAGLDDALLDSINARLPKRRSSIDPPSPAAYGMSIVSWAVGVAFGRFREDAVVSDDCLSSSINPFVYSGRRSPAMATCSARDVMVADEGHEGDLTEHVSAVLERTIGASTAVLRDVEDLIGMPLRSWLATRYFNYHIANYSMGGRSAPIYWQLATPSQSYSIWLYTHSFSKDTIFRVQNDYAAPKLAHEERQFETLTRELKDKTTAAQRRELAAKEGHIEELRAFLEEVKRVAPLLNPNLDDGVVINFAPLWRLVPQNKSWQKELKSTWDGLREGEYDWAHLAMHLWPERVVPKCASDRSLAIAHGLEDVFWVEGQDGKSKPRPTPKRPIDEIVRERTSVAVKAALKELVEASGQTSPKGRTRRSSP
jgi:hypothetical protein